MRWTPENDQLLLVMLLETHNINVKGEKISAAWPQDGREAPSPRAITERIVKIRALAKTALAASPLANNTSYPSPTNTTTEKNSPEKKKKRAAAAGASANGVSKKKKKAKDNFDDDEEVEESRPKKQKRKVKNELGGIGNGNGGYNNEGEESLMSARI